VREARPGATCFDQPDNIVGQVWARVQNELK
jgi:hypothetical protein